MKNCGSDCYECIICKGKKVCCSCDWNNGYHACVKSKRKGNEADKSKLLETGGTSTVRMDSSHRKKGQAMSWNEEHQENAYCLKKKKEYSTVFTEEIRKLFEERIKDYQYDLSRGPRGYHDEEVSRRWSDFFNGFRLGEDARKATLPSRKIT